MSKPKFTRAVLITAACLLTAAPTLAQNKPRITSPTAHQTVEQSLAKNRGSGGPAAGFLAAAALFALVIVGASK
jgi:hypothetical protein